jgi:hypothetical protein
VAVGVATEAVTATVAEAVLVAEIRAVAAQVEIADAVAAVAAVAEEGEISSPFVFECCEY